MKRILGILLVFCMGCASTGEEPYTPDSTTNTNPYAQQYQHPKYYTQPNAGNAQVRQLPSQGDKYSIEIVENLEIDAGLIFSICFDKEISKNHLSHNVLFTSSSIEVIEEDTQSGLRFKEIFKFKDKWKRKRMPKYNILIMKVYPTLAPSLEYELKVYVDEDDGVYKLQLGDRTLSTTYQKPKAKGTSSIHTVKEKENLKLISNKYNISVAKLKEINGLTSDKISPGQRLKVK